MRGKPFGYFLVFLPLSGFALLGCSPRVIALRTMASMLDEGAQAYYEEPDPVLAEESLASQLKLLEALLKNDPANPRLLALAAQGFDGYSFLFLEDTQPDRARQFYLRGRAWAFKLLDRNPSLRNLDSMPLPALEQALLKASARDAPGLFWAAYGWGGWINLSKDSPDAVAGLPKAAALMRRVQELSPGYYYGGPDLFLGSYFASLPKMLGGDPAKAKEHFEAAMRVTGGRFLAAKLLYAKYYAVAVQDEALFRSMNQEVLAASNALPEARLANEVAKIKAKHLLEKTHDLF